MSKVERKIKGRGGWKKGEQRHTLALFRFWWLRAEDEDAVALKPKLGIESEFTPELGLPLEHAIILESKPEAPRMRWCFEVTGTLSVSDSESLITTGSRECDTTSREISPSVLVWDWAQVGVDIGRRVPWNIWRGRGYRWPSWTGPWRHSQRWSKRGSLEWSRSDKPHAIGQELPLTLL